MGLDGGVGVCGWVTEEEEEVEVVAVVVGRVAAIGTWMFGMDGCFDEAGDPGGGGGGGGGGGL